MTAWARFLARGGVTYDSTRIFMRAIRIRRGVRMRREKSSANTETG